LESKVFILIATLGLSWAGPLNKKNTDALSGAHSHDDGGKQVEAQAPDEPASAPDERKLCPSSSTNSGIIRSRFNEVVPMDPETQIYVQHKVDIDAGEDRCINAVLIEHQPVRGCKYTMLFNAVRGSHNLQLTSLELDADSWCPGWGDPRETGETGNHRSYTKGMGGDGLSLVLSRSHVTDFVADRSCTQLTMSTQGEIFLSRGLGGRAERFSFENLQFTGQYDSVGEPSSFCPSPPPVVVREEPKAPQENVFQNTAVLGFVGHEPIPNFPAIDGGLSVLQSFGDRFTLRGDISMGPLKHTALYGNFMFGKVSGKPGLRPYVGLRVGGFDSNVTHNGDSITTPGFTLGMETNRAVKSSRLYGSFEVSPVFYGEDLRAYMSSDPDLYTSMGVMFKLHVGMFLR
jgi:hypothetical protein